MEHRVWDYPLRFNHVQVSTQALVPGPVQPLRLPRGRGTGRGDNGSSRGQRAPGRGQRALHRGAARHREDRDDANVIADVIDIGSSHSYSPGQPVRVDKVYRRVPLKIQGVVFSENLMEFSFGEFDLILGVDSLTEHRANLDSASKRVTLKFKGDIVIVMIGERQDCLSNVITTLVVERLVRKGCEAYLAFVSDSGSKKPSITDIQIVKDFLDVFLDELPRVPSNREVEFGIKLLPSTIPVSIAHYRMAPKELIEFYLVWQASVLVQPESGREFVPYRNTSHVRLGYILMQDSKVVAYASRQLK
ncbi:hypothetical protein EPI10_015840 [Gossypium australe]|uniref:DNA/RNA polymerases superfamily protein n=1 Tax=Gossypium australe TaxID=47621 RepID=A0A5B6VM96_9ROSI|nr:hypothetical protein EPI10_015840 [Gossypium australe]